MFRRLLGISKTRFGTILEQHTSPFTASEYKVGVPLGKRSPNGGYRLRAETDRGEMRFLDVNLTSNGDLVIRGHDLGAGVSDVFGSGMDEYEWREIIRAPHFADLRRVLDVPNGDLLHGITSRYAGKASYDFEERIRGSGIPVELETWLR